MVPALSSQLAYLPMSWDCCAYLAEAIGAMPYWGQFLLCSNNAGGDVYYVPKELRELARVEEHMTATERFWKIAYPRQADRNLPFTPETAFP